MPAPYRAALIAAAITLFCGLGLLVDDGKADMAIVAIGAITLTLTTARVWTLRTGRAFVHGYHAGYHEGREDREVTSEPCAVIALAEQRNGEFHRLPA